MTKEESKIIAEFISQSSKAVFKEMHLKECVEMTKLLNTALSIVNKYMQEPKQLTKQPKMSLKNANK